MKAEKKALPFSDICKLAVIERESLKSLDRKTYSIEKVMNRFEIGISHAKAVIQHLRNNFPIPKAVAK